MTVSTLLIFFVFSSFGNSAHRKPSLPQYRAFFLLRRFYAGDANKTACVTIFEQSLDKTADVAYPHCTSTLPYDTQTLAKDVDANEKDAHKSFKQDLLYSGNDGRFLRVKSVSQHTDDYILSMNYSISISSIVCSPDHRHAIIYFKESEAAFDFYDRARVSEIVTSQDSFLDASGTPLTIRLKEVRMIDPMTISLYGSTTQGLELFEALQLELSTNALTATTEDENVYDPLFFKSKTTCQMRQHTMQNKTEKSKASMKIPELYDVEGENKVLSEMKSEDEHNERTPYNSVLQCIQGVYDVILQFLRSFRNLVSSILQREENHNPLSNNTIPVESHSRPLSPMISHSRKSISSSRDFSDLPSGQYLDSDSNTHHSDYHTLYNRIRRNHWSILHSPEGLSYGSQSYSEEDSEADQKDGNFFMPRFNQTYRWLFGKRRFSSEWNIPFFPTSLLQQLQNELGTSSDDLSSTERFVDGYFRKPVRTVLEDIYVNASLRLSPTLTFSVDYENKLNALRLTVENDYEYRNVGHLKFRMDRALLGHFKFSLPLLHSHLGGITFLVGYVPLSICFDTNPSLMFSFYVGSDTDVDFRTVTTGKYTWGFNWKRKVDQSSQFVDIERFASHSNPRHVPFGFSRIFHSCLVKRSKSEEEASDDFDSYFDTFERAGSHAFQVSKLEECSQLCIARNRKQNRILPMSFSNSSLGGPIADSPRRDSYEWDELSNSYFGETDSQCTFFRTFRKGKHLFCELGKSCSPSLLVHEGYDEFYRFDAGDYKVRPAVSSDSRLNIRWFFEVPFTAMFAVGPCQLSSRLGGPYVALELGTDTHTTRKMSKDRQRPLERTELQIHVNFYLSLSMGLRFLFLNAHILFLDFSALRFNLATTRIFLHYSPLYLLTVTWDGGNRSTCREWFPQMNEQFFPAATELEGFALITPVDPEISLSGFSWLPELPEIPELPSPGNVFPIN